MSKTNSNQVSSDLSRPGLSRRGLLQAGGVVLLLGRQHIAQGASIVAVRVWPAPDYSRVTLESDIPLTAKPIFVPTPPPSGRGRGRAGSEPRPQGTGGQG